MTYTYTFDNCVILQQTGSAFINSETAAQLRKLQEAGYQVDAVHNFPEGERCYVILSLPTRARHCQNCQTEFRPESTTPDQVYCSGHCYREDNFQSQWNSAKSYIAEMTEIHDTRS